LCKIKKPKRKEPKEQRQSESSKKELIDFISNRRKNKQSARPIPTTIKKEPNKCLKAIWLF
jgi:hypothetical protein